MHCEFVAVSPKNLGVGGRLTVVEVNKVLVCCVRDGGACGGARRYARCLPYFRSVLEAMDIATRSAVRAPFTPQPIFNLQTEPVTPA